MAATIKLIATDLDGTLIGSTDEMPVYSDFAERIRDLRISQGTSWAVLSGRPLRSFLECSEPLRVAGLLPDYAILRYSLIYQREGESYRLLWRWSLATLWKRVLRPIITRRVLREWHVAALETFRGTRTLTNTPQRLQLRFKSEQAAESAAAALKERVKGLDHVQTALEGAVLEVRSFLYLKGLSLKELERQLGIEPDAVLAIGNGYHDLSIMNERIARLTGCPANSHARVIEKVSQTGGHIARQRALAGVVEILNAYITDAVDSSVPPSWRAPGSLRQSGGSSSAMRDQRRKMFFRWTALAVVGYATLMAFASCNLLPYSRIIMKPFEVVVRLVTRLLSWF
jgi:hydroxymethylpyrimidine pyrophosphatase-like HAD family hydrolase